jgi:predicted double-glycine peptidase
MKKFAFAITWVGVLLLTWINTPVAREGVWIDVPFVKQEKNRCGAACISMVMQYWSALSNAVYAPASLSAIEIGKALYSEAVGGIFGKDMERYFKKQGYQTFVFKGEWPDLEQHLSKGRPVIVGLEVNGRGALSHYVVVTGLDPQNGFVLMNDPAQRKLLKMSRASFEKAWEQTTHWTLLAVPSSSPTKALD